MLLARALQPLELVGQVEHLEQLVALQSATRVNERPFKLSATATI